MFRPLAFLIVALATTSAALAAEPAKLKVLFLGDKGHHKPADRFKQLEPLFAKRGIELVYTEKLEDLNEKTLAGYDALMVYANTVKISDGAGGFSRDLFWAKLCNVL